MTEEVKKIIEEHQEADEKILLASMTTDFKTNNREMKKLAKLVEKISKDMGVAIEVYSVLLKSSNVITMLNASAECLKLGIFLDMAVENLEKLSMRTDIGITSFDAKMTLAEWRRNR